MGKGTFIALVALLVAIAGTIVAFAAYFKRRSCAICDDFDDMMDDDLDGVDYYATQVDDMDDDECESCCCCHDEDHSPEEAEKEKKDAE